jgi:hypothetical protein
MESVIVSIIEDYAVGPDFVVAEYVFILMVRFLIFLTFFKYPIDLKFGFCWIWVRMNKLWWDDLFSFRVEIQKDKRERNAKEKILWNLF